MSWYIILKNTVASANLRIESFIVWHITFSSFSIGFYTNHQPYLQLLQMTFARGPTYSEISDQLI